MRMYGRMASCGRLSIGFSICGPAPRPIANRPQVTNLPYIAVAGLLCTISFGQGTVDPAKLLTPPTDSWPTYNGDYSGRRFSPLTKINAENIQSLALAWVYRANPGQNPQGGGGAAYSVIKGTPLVINGVMYFTLPDHV